MKSKITFFAFLALTLVSGFNLKAQDNERKFKPFQVELGVPLNFGMSASSSFGTGFYIAPRYAASDQVHIGIKTGWFNLGEGSWNVNGNDVDIEGVVVVPVLLTGEYYFNTDKTRPFVGMGLGMFRRNEFEFKSSQGNINYNENETKINFGFAPQIGVNSGHFRLSAAYNVTGQSIANYFSLNLGIDLGGGRVRY